MKKTLAIAALAALLTAPALAQEVIPKYPVSQSGQNTFDPPLDCQPVDPRPGCQTAAVPSMLPQSNSDYQGGGMGPETEMERGRGMPGGEYGAGGTGAGAGIPSGGTPGNFGSNGGSSGTGN